jgi:hypothetical protein
VPRLSYRPYQPEDAEGLCRLQAAVFGTTRTPEYWHWKYRANPAGSDHTWVAEDTDTKCIVGINGLVPLRIGVSGEQVIARRQGNGDCAFVFAFGEAVTIKVSTALMGYVAVGPTPRVVRPLSLQAGAPPRWRGVARLADRVFRVVGRVRGASPPRGATIAAVHRFDERYDCFWSEEAKRHPLAVWRDAAYLNWRYLDGPEQGYEAYGMERDGQVLGFTVLRQVEVDGRARGRILELIATEDDPALTRALLAHALRQFDERRLEMAAAWVFAADPRWTEMKALGFRSRPRPGRQMVVRPVSDLVPAELIARPDNWRISWGDSVDD